MARGRYEPGVSLGETCGVCGADEWKHRHRDGHDVRYCAVCARRTGRERKARAREQNPFKVLLDGARQRAAAKGLPFTITEEDVLAAWPEDGACPVLGIPLKRGSVGGAQGAAPTLDRLNNAWGYEPGNIAVISHRANTLKSDASAAEIERLAAWMHAQGLS